MLTQWVPNWVRLPDGFGHGSKLKPDSGFGMGLVEADSTKPDPIARSPSTKKWLQPKVEYDWLCLHSSWPPYPTWCLPVCSSLAWPMRPHSWHISNSWASPKNSVPLSRRDSFSFTSSTQVGTSTSRKHCCRQHLQPSASVSWWARHTPSR